ncbi:MAG TPA: 50S ribosomal protein L7/L12 [Candidatus Azoamicus sp. OHIO2]
MSINNEDIINAISKMNMLDLMDLIKEIEKKFNISTDNVNIKTTSNVQAELVNEKVEEKTSFTVEMVEYGTSKVNVIKTIRTILDLGLKEAKDFVENLPATIKKDISILEAEKIKTSLETAGAKIILK